VRDSHDLLPGSLADQPVDVGEPEEPANARRHHRVDRGDLQAALTEVSDVELDVGTLDPD
jgi:hypothetical protein